MSPAFSRGTLLRRRAVMRFVCRRTSDSRLSEHTKVELQQARAVHWRLRLLPVINLPLRLAQACKKLIISDAPLGHKVAVLASHYPRSPESGPPSAQTGAESAVAQGEAEPQALIHDDPRQQPPKHRAGVILQQKIDLVSSHVLENPRVQHFAQSRATNVVRDCVWQI